MDGIKNVLQFLYENWINILICTGLIIGIVQKTREYFLKSKEERIKIAKTQIKEIILKLITQAELDYDDWNRAGLIKRSQVINEIFKEYPILSTIASQENVIKWIDNEIDNALYTLEDIVVNSDIKIKNSNINNIDNNEK